MKIAVLGSGIMGKRIALLFAGLGCDVVLWSHSPKEILPKELKRESRLWGLDFSLISARLISTENLEGIVGSSLIIEAVVEDIDIKTQLLKQVSLLSGPEVTITSNTSSLSINALSQKVQYPERFHGLHFFNPPQQMKFVEISKTISTAMQTIENTKKLLEQFSIAYVLVDDLPGFIVNHLLFSMINSAVTLMENSHLEPAMIDKAMKLGAKYPMGPLELADFIGLDVCLMIFNNLFERTGDSKFRAPVLLRELVQKGEMGRKTGKGFYQY